MAPVASPGVWWGLLCALGSAACYGVASVMQAVAARAEPSAERGVDPMLLVRLVRRWRFVAGIGLDLAGFVAQFAALRVLPLFVVQAAVAASLAVTAMTARWVLGSVLGRRGWSGVALVSVGLAALGGSAGSEGSGGSGGDVRLAVLVCAVGLVGFGLAAGRAPRSVRAPGLGLVAGFGFGVVAIASRLLSSFDPSALVADPAAYAVVLGGLIAFGFYAAALQVGSVTTVTTMLIVGETVGPAVVGVALLGDQPRQGWAWVAALGFIAVLLGAGALAGFGELDDQGSAPRPGHLGTAERG